MAQIIVLNGTSSSGKTAIARAIQAIAPEVFLNFSIDSVLYALPQHILEKMMRGDEIAEIAFRDLVRGYYAALKGLADSGLALISDNAITARYQAEALADALNGHDALLVQVECAVDVAEVRETSRGDRRPGLARLQASSIHRWLAYDVTVDSASGTPEEVARQILDVAFRSEHEGISRTRERLTVADAAAPDSQRA